jgi:hypothetical protein
MSKYNFSIILFIVFIFCFPFIGCDNGTQNIGDNNINNDNTITDDNQNTGNDKINLLKGTIWYADSGSLFIEFPDHLN